MKRHHKSPAGGHAPFQAQRSGAHLQTPGVIKVIKYDLIVISSCPVSNEDTTRDMRRSMCQRSEASGLKVIDRLL